MNLKKQISQSFWGQYWCRNLAEFEDMPQRLALARRLYRQGAIKKIKITGPLVKTIIEDAEGRWPVSLTFAPMDYDVFKRFAAYGAKHIESFQHLLSGQFPPDLMKWILANPDGRSLFPTVKDIKGSCRCLDDSYLCAHKGAILYHLAYEFDHDPWLFFRLRQVPKDCFLSLTEEEPEKFDVNFLEEVFQINLI